MRKLRTSISYSDGVIYPTLFMLFADWVDRWFYRQMLQMYLNSKCPPGRLWYCKCIQIPDIHHRKDFNFTNVQVLWLPKVVKHGKCGFPMGRRSSCTVYSLHLKICVICQQYAKDTGYFFLHLHKVHYHACIISWPAKLHRLLLSQKS